MQYSHQTVDIQNAAWPRVRGAGARLGLLLVCLIFSLWFVDPRNDRGPTKARKTRRSFQIPISVQSRPI
jgi:hypothetical protein